MAAGKKLVHWLSNLLNSLTLPVKEQFGLLLYSFSFLFISTFLFLQKNTTIRLFICFSHSEWFPSGFVQKIRISSQSWSPTVFTFMNPYKEP